LRLSPGNPYTLVTPVIFKAATRCCATLAITGSFSDTAGVKRLPDRDFT
jgi:hypothetical protein